MNKATYILYVLALLLVFGTQSASAYTYTEIGASQSVSSNFTLSQSFGAAGIQSILLNLTSTSTKTNSYNTTCTVANGCIIWAKFDENTGKYVSDSSGNNNNGTWVGNNTQNWTTGKYNSGGNFSIDNKSYVNFSQISQADAANKTVSLWFTQDGTSTSEAIVTKWNSTTVGCGWGITKISSNRISVTAFNESRLPTQGVYSVPSAGTLTHLAVAFTVNNIETFVNGNSAGNITMTGNCSIATQNLIVGAYSYTGTIYYNSMIDDFKLFNSTWNTSQVQQEFLISAEQIRAKTNSNPSYSNYFNSSSDNPLSLTTSSTDSDISSISFTAPSSVVQNGITIYDYINNTNFSRSVNINYFITNNVNYGWNTLINQDMKTYSTIPDNFFVSQYAIPQYPRNISLIQSPGHGLWYNTSAPTYGQVYIGQIYPAGHVRYRLNVSIENDIGTPYLFIEGGNSGASIGGLFRVVVRNNSVNQKTVYLYYYNSTGYEQTDKSFIVSTPYTDLYIEEYSNGSITVTNVNNPSQSLSGITHLDWNYPYPYISETILALVASMGVSNYMNVSIYNFEQAVPNNLISILADNSTFPFGFDGPRANYSYGTDWLKNRGQLATLWIGETNYAALNVSQKADVQDLILNQTFELGNHYTESLTTLDYPTFVTRTTLENANVSALFGGRRILSWCSLANSDNLTHANSLWQNYSMLWRNAPNSIGMFSNIGNIFDDNSGNPSGLNTTTWWRLASRHKTYVPAFTHSVLVNMNESYSMNVSSFNLIFGNYTNSGIKIIPYAEWYYSNELTITNITNVYFSPSNSYFNINTTGYNATTQINDPNIGGNWFWYAKGGTVTTRIGSSNITNLTINTPSNLTVAKAGTITPIDYTNFTASVVSWNISGNCEVIINENATNPLNTATHSITNTCWAGYKTNIYVDNTLITTTQAGSDGTIVFNYIGGYSSSHTFKISISSVPQSLYGWQTARDDVPVMWAGWTNALGALILIVVVSVVIAGLYIMRNSGTTAMSTIVLFVLLAVVILAVGIILDLAPSIAYSISTNIPP